MSTARLIRANGTERVIELCHIAPTVYEPLILFDGRLQPRIFRFNHLKGGEYVYLETPDPNPVWILEGEEKC